MHKDAKQRINLSILRAGILALTLLFCLTGTSLAASRTSTSGSTKLATTVANNPADDDEVDVEVQNGDTTDYSTDSPTAATVPLTRWYNPNPDADVHYTSPSQGQEVQNTSYYAEGSGIGNLGYIYSNAQPNSQPLFSCYYFNIFRNGVANWKVGSYFLTTDSACEGQMRMVNWRSGPIGYISTVSLDNSQPLYRCFRSLGSHGTDHFYTHDSDCEGAGTSEGLIGYTQNAP